MTVQSLEVKFQKATKIADTLDVSAPQLPRCRKVPRRFEVGSADGDFPATPEGHYRRIYFQAIDLIIACITDRFHQIGYQMYRNVQDLLLKAARGGDYQTQFDFVTHFYGSGFNPQLLSTQLQVLSTNFIVDPASDIVLSDAIGFFKTLTPAKQDLPSEVCVLLRLFLVTNAVSERLFSALRRVKTYIS